eukprot:bmy_08598T0
MSSLSLRPLTMPSATATCWTYRSSWAAPREPYFRAPSWAPQSPLPRPSAAPHLPPPRPLCLWGPLWPAWPLRGRPLSAWRRWRLPPAGPGRPGSSTTTRQPTAASWPCWLTSSSLSTACLAWTLTGSLAREATRRARSLSPTWNCLAKQAPSQAPAHSGLGRRGWVQPCHLSCLLATQLLRVGKLTPSHPAPGPPAARGPRG